MRAIEGLQRPTAGTTQAMVPADRRAKRLTDSISTRPLPSTASLAIESYGPTPAASVRTIEWRHPLNGRLFYIDQRTGYSIAVGPETTAEAGGSGPSRLQQRPFLGPLNTVVNRSNLKRRLEDAPSNHRTTTAIDGNASIDEFDDPSLDQVLAAIPSPTSAVLEGPFRCSRIFHSRRPKQAEKSTDLRSDGGKDTCAGIGLLPMNNVELSITRSALQRAQVLDQVDGKFILCCTTAPASTSGPILFCVDQHAADERYRLERMLELYSEDCVAGTAAHPLPCVLTMPITAKQKELIESNPAVRSGLHSMGWLVKDVFLIYAGDAQVDLSGIPHILRDKALTDRGSVKNIRLLETSFADCLEAAVSWDCAIDSGGEDWLTLSRSMPASLMNVVKSAACRSAIMFNDELAREACERVVRRLGGCRFPFQCAHGRPSLVPLCGVKTTLWDDGSDATG
nr:mismatch repair and meiotic recombination protein [Pseudozyma pruni]